MVWSSRIATAVALLFAASGTAGAAGIEENENESMKGIATLLSQGFASAAGQLPQLDKTHMDRLVLAFGQDATPHTDLQSRLEHYLQQPASQTAVDHQEEAQTDVFLLQNVEEQHSLIGERLMQGALAVLQGDGERDVGDTKCDLECAAAGVATYFACAAACAKKFEPEKAVICVTTTCPPAVAAATQTCLKENPACKDDPPGPAAIPQASVEELFV